MEANGLQEKRNDGSGWLRQLLEERNEGISLMSKEERLKKRDNSQTYCGVFATGNRLLWERKVLLFFQGKTRCLLMWQVSSSILFSELLQQMAIPLRRKEKLWNYFDQHHTRELEAKLYAFVCLATFETFRRKTDRFQCGVYAMTISISQVFFPIPV